jgi:hypothetical protein
MMLTPLADNVQFSGRAHDAVSRSAATAGLPLAETSYQPSYERFAKIKAGEDMSCNRPEPQKQRPAYQRYGMNAARHHHVMHRDR